MAEMKPFCGVPKVKNKGEDIEITMFEIPKWIAKILLAWAKLTGKDKDPMWLMD